MTRLPRLGPSGVHTHGGPSPSSLLGRVILLCALGAVAIATVVGLVALWPDAAKVAAVQADTQYVIPDASFESARVEAITEGCGTTAQGDTQISPGEGGVTACETADVTILTGPKAGQRTQVHLGGPYAGANISVGDRIELLSVPQSGPNGESGGTLESFFGVDRSQSLLVLLILFVMIVGLVAWLRGLLALLALAFSGVMVVAFVLPAVISGRPGLLVALVAAAATMFVVLYVAHGPSIRTSTALAGTLCGVAITALVAQLSIGAVRLSGYTDEASNVLSGLSGGFDFRGLLACGIVFAGLGVLNDVTITQASAVWELRAAGPGLSRRQLFWSSMRIGRDHIASTIYTIVFAYVGTSLSVLLLLYLYDLPAAQLLTFEDLAAEVVMTLCSAIGLVLAVPLTSAIAVLLAAAPRPGGAPPLEAPPSAPAPGERRRRRAPATPDELTRPLDWDF